MNKHNDIDLTYTRNRLKQWGLWCRAILTMGLNYSSKSIIEQLAKHRGTLTKNTLAQLAPENFEAEEIDYWINQYAKEDGTKARLLLLHYAAEGKISEKLDIVKLPKYAYYRQLEQAERWISRQL